MKAAFDPLRLDVEAFARAGKSLVGAWPLADLPRLSAVSRSDAPAPGASEVTWQARGESRAVRGGEPQIWLHLETRVNVAFECQRCLQAVRVPLAVRRAFLFVRGEEAAAELDADMDDDVLALSRALDLRELVEDELLLALPLVPRHESCPEPLKLPADDPIEEEEKPNPFAALAALKRGQLPN